MKLNVLLNFFNANIILFVSFLLSLIPIYSPEVKKILPLFFVCVIYFSILMNWYRFPIWVLFLFGIIQDSILGLPIGVHSIIYVLCALIMDGFILKYFKKNYLYFWVGAIIYLSFYILLEYLAYSLVIGQLLNIVNSLIQLLLTIVLYPLIHNMLDILYKFLMKKASHAR